MRSTRPARCSSFAGFQGNSRLTIHRQRDCRLSPWLATSVASRIDAEPIEKPIDLVLLVVGAEPAVQRGDPM